MEIEIYHRRQRYNMLELDTHKIVELYEQTEDERAVSIKDRSFLCKHVFLENFPGKMLAIYVLRKICFYRRRWMPVSVYQRLCPFQGPKGEFMQYFLRMIYEIASIGCFDRNKIRTTDARMFFPLFISRLF